MIKALQWVGEKCDYATAKKIEKKQELRGVENV
jgi:hypothetical protein